MSLCGTGESHCCWLGRGGKCRFVERSELSGYRWQCSLRIKYKSWPAVHRSLEYTQYVKPWMRSAGYWVDCGDWPPPGVKCNDCGQVNNG